MKKNNLLKKGIAEVVVVVTVLVVLVLAAIAYWYYSQDGQYMMQETTSETMQYEPVVSMEPISQSSDSATLEAEVEATLEGSFEDDLLLMEKDASSL